MQKRSKLMRQKNALKENQYKSKEDAWRNIEQLGQLFLILVKDIRHEGHATGHKGLMLSAI